MIKEVPVDICDNCGEIYAPDMTAEQIMSLDIRGSGYYRKCRERGTKLYQVIMSLNRSRFIAQLSFTTIPGPIFFVTLDPNVT